MAVFYTEFDSFVGSFGFSKLISRLNDAKHLDSIGVKINPNSYL